MAPKAFAVAVELLGVGDLQPSELVDGKIYLVTVPYQSVKMIEMARATIQQKLDDAGLRKARVIVVPDGTKFYHLEEIVAGNTE